MFKAEIKKQHQAFNGTLRSLLLVFFCLVLASPAKATQEKLPAKTKEAYLSEGQLTLDGTTLNYEAIAAETLVPANNQLPAARYFSFSYLYKGELGTNRPVTFLFNGGPGSASHWLHLGGTGPKRALIDINSHAPYPITTNSESLLTASDLVFIDPIGTGFSRPTRGNPTSAPSTPKHAATQEFWGVVEDAKSITDFILTWLKQHDRKNSPIFFVGESYGALRATLIADELEREHQLSIKGLILLSAVQNYRNIRTPDGSVMGYVSYFPTYAATAWHHKKAGKSYPELEPFLEKARNFAANEYASALINGNRLSDKEKSELADKMSYYIGLNPAYIFDNNLRIEPLVYLKRMFPVLRKKISRLDSRYTGPLEDPKSTNYGLDPYATIIREPFITATQRYVNDVLKVPTQKGEYIASARKHPYWRWNWNVWGEGNVPSGARFINVIPNLERTLAANSSLKVMVASGYYDFATPFYGAENAFAELVANQDRIMFQYYKSGHILYLDETVRGQLSSDIKSFIAVSQ